MTGLFGGIFILFQHYHFVVFCLHVRVQSRTLHYTCAVVWWVFLVFLFVFTIVPHRELDIVITFSRNHCAFQTYPGLFQGWIVDRDDCKSLSCLLLSLRKVRNFGVATRHAECLHAFVRGHKVSFLIDKNKFKSIFVI